MSILNKKSLFYCGYLNENYKPQGYGILINKNNDSIKGTFDDGITRVIDSSSEINNTKYLGTIIDGSLDNKGKIIFSDGAIYTGMVSKGFQHGKGRMIYKENKIYDGEWNMGYPDGFGELIYDNVHFKGNWIAMHEQYNH